MKTTHSSHESGERQTKILNIDDLFVRICKNAIMASIGEDDLFDEDIVTQYLKEVTFITV